MTQEEIIKLSSNAILLIIFCVVHSLLARGFVKKFLTRIIKEESFRFIYVIISIVTLGIVLFFWKPIGKIVWFAEGPLFWVLNIISFFCFFGGCYSVLTINYMDFLSPNHVFPVVSIDTCGRSG